MSPLDFFLTVLAMVLASVISAVILALLGFVTVKHLINKGMESEAVQRFQKAFDDVVKALEELYAKIEKLFNNNPEG